MRQMRAKAKFILAAMLISSSHALAAKNDDICTIIANSDPDYILSKLRSFAPDVLGKPAISWSRDDLVNLSNNIISCDGLPKGPANSQKVVPWRWHNQLNMAGQIILPINDINRAIQQAYSPIWKWSEIPNCQGILDWKRDKVWNTNNSAEIFGKDFQEATPEEAAIISGFINECVVVAKKILETNRLDSNAAMKIAEDLRRTIDKEQEAAKEKNSDIAPSLRIYHNNKRIPLAYLGPQSRKWVDFVNRFELQNTSMRVEDMVTVSKWTEMVLSSKKQTPETAFGEAVRNIITKRMFNQNNKNSPQ
jgi:hypothetical protein